MKALSRLGSGRIANWFNGWWVVGAALLIGVGGPLMMTFRASRIAEARAQQTNASALFETRGGGVTLQPQPGSVSLEDARLVRDNLMSQRMQMTIALSLSAALRLARARVEKGIPVDTGALYAGLVRERINGKSILPNGFSGPLEGSDGEAVIMSSADGLYLLRFSAEKGMVEVISVSKEAGSSEPAMLARTPDDHAIFGDQIGFYTRYEVDAALPGSRRGLQGVLVPAFGDSSRMVGSGWRVVKLSLPRGGATGRGGGGQR